MEDLIEQLEILEGMPKPEQELVDGLAEEGRIHPYYAEDKEDTIKMLKEKLNDSNNN